jgi:hypothetical protein
VKSNMYSHIIGVDDSLWDIMEDGITIPVDEKGVAIDRKKLTDAQRKIYRKHHKVRGLIVDVLPHNEYLKLSDKLTATTIFNFFAQTMKVTRRLEKPKLIL